MKPCASINAYFDGEFNVPVEVQMQRVADAGFRHLDMNFWDWAHSPASPQRADDWQAWVERIGMFAKLMDIRFTQSHAHVYNFYTAENPEIHEEQVRRSIEGAGMLGIPWIVMHPSPKPDADEPGSREKTFADNVEYFRRHAERAAQIGVGLALENMSRSDYGLNTAEGLCELIDAIGMPNVGACWDTGHANLAKQDQPAAIRTLGSRLHALHIADNLGERDEHTIPFLGNIEWPPIIAALREIGYPGDFTFEAHTIVRRMPESCKAEAMRLMYRIGDTLSQEY